MNGVFVVNATIDMSMYSYCQDLYITIFGSAQGIFKNVTITGFVNVTHLDLTNFTTNNIIFSNFFGKLGW